MTCPHCGTLNPNERDDCIRCRRKLHPEGMRGKIACAIHANREATTSCASCGVRLCGACAVPANGVDFCDNCAPANALRPTYDEDYERVPVVNPTQAGRASFGPRALALLIDAGVIFAAAMVLAMAFWLLSGDLQFMISPRDEPVGWTLYWLVIVLGIPAYVTVLTAMTGQTLGKQVAGVIVLQPDGKILSLRASLIRTFAAILSALPLGLGFLWALWDPACETWHDKLARTAAFRWSEQY